MAQLFTNNATTTLASGVAEGTLALVVTDGSVFPSPTATDFFMVTLYSVSGTTEVDHEIIKCTGRTGNTLTVQRAQEGTTARVWNTGTPVELRVTAGTLDGFSQESAVNSSVSAGSVGGVRATITTGLNSGAHSVLEAVQGDNPTPPRMAFRTNSQEQGAWGPNGTLLVGTVNEYPWAADQLSKRVQIGETTALWERSNVTWLTNNLYYDGSTWRYVQAGAAAALTLNSTSGGLYLTGAGMSNGLVESWNSIIGWTASGVSFSQSIDVAVGMGYKVAGTQVIGSRQTGWTAATGNSYKEAFYSDTATLLQCAQRIKALEEVLRAHGLIN